MEKRGGKTFLWSWEAFILCFSEMKERFGAHETWETSVSPGHGLDEEYEEFCVNMAGAIGAAGPGAVKQQVGLATRKFSETKACKPDIQKAIWTARIAAYETRFVRPRAHKQWIRVVAKPTKTKA